MKHDLECTEVLFHYGNPPNCVILECTPNHLKPEDILLAAKNPILSVIPTTPKLSYNIEHDSPALINEYYKVTIHLDSHSDTIADGTISFDLFGTLENPTVEIRNPKNMELFHKDRESGKLEPLYAVEGEGGSIFASTTHETERETINSRFRKIQRNTTRKNTISDLVPPREK
eukprot:TRINITY_DN2008_c0_g1_i2.p1 TRINITY_DN2008_c0_g1~~TRINITY_DN2008_c0_g1_i2.p1  ORF type:complete len:173 (-),score=25.09 TRINITY_DN2008_c0_g1_i2:128-646(-)